MYIICWLRGWNLESILLNFQKSDVDSLFETTNLATNVCEDTAGIKMYSNLVFKGYNSSQDQFPFTQMTITPLLVPYKPLTRLKNTVNDRLLWWAVGILRWRYLWT